MRLPSLFNIKCAILLELGDQPHQLTQLLLLARDLPRRTRFFQSLGRRFTLVNLGHGVLCRRVLINLAANRFELRLLPLKGALALQL